MADKEKSTTTRQMLAEKFWPKASKRGPGECWPWTAACDRHGYGQIRVSGKTKLAHRVSWALHNGPIPDGLCVLHRCDNPPCVNPEHLWLGTVADNNVDRAAKGRNVDQKGEASVCAKLNENLVLAIRADPRIQRKIARWCHI